MDSTNQKNYFRPWSAEELRENAENWSLAGDVALLNTIKAFSENLLSKTGEISDKIDTLLNSIDEAGLKLDLAQNEFQNLKNTQFIESRVYDDDETLDSKEEEKVSEVPIPEDEQEKCIINSIKMGMEILEEYYDKLEVSVSDSEEDTEKSSKFYEYILKPKDMYAHRPLPPVIGSDEWYKKWHLDDLSSDSESEKVSDIYSESDSEDNLPKGLVKGSETSSELDFSSHASENRPVASSTFNSQHVDLESSSAENEEQDSELEKTPLANQSFAEQLAAKLGNIISEQEVVPEEINKRPIHPAKTSNIVGIPFDDEPPPLDELEHSILPKNIHTGYFSGGQGLFDDNDEDEPFWGQPNKSSEVADEPTVKEPKQHNQSKLTKGLFDESSSDEEMFTTTKKQSDNIHQYLTPKQHSVGFFDDEPPEFQDKSKSQRDEPEKKPIGGVRLMGSSDIFNDKKISKILKDSAIENSREKEKTPQIETVKQETSTKPKRINLFDDDEFDDFLDIEKKPNKEKSANLFDDNETNDEIPSSKTFEVNNTSTDKKLSLFDDDSEVSIPHQPKKISLFDDDDELFNEDEDFFSSITKTKLSSKLFEDIEDEKNDDMFNIKSKSEGAKNDLFGNDDEKVENRSTKIQSSSKNYMEDVIKTEENVVNEATEILNPLEASEKQNLQKTSDIKKKTFGLFDDSDFEDDGIFGGKIKSKEEKLESHGNDVAKKHGEFKTVGYEVEKLGKNGSSLESEYLKNSKDEIEEGVNVTPPIVVLQEPTPTKPKENLSNIPISPFDSVPPPDDCEDWDTKSDSLSDVEDFVPYRADETYSRSSVFDNEPPSLGPNESSGIVRDCSTNRIETDDSSFIPPASSSRRFSSEIFSEQQSQDSFFVTKNKTESVNPGSLGVIPEAGQADVTEITPSGDLQDFDSTTVSQTSSKQQTQNTKSEEPEDWPETEDMLPIRNSTSENILNRIASFEKNLQRDSTDKPSAEPKSSPGKLKHNLLNINVNALRPTLGPPKLRPKSFHVDETDYISPEPQENVPSPVPSKTVTFNQQTGNVEGHEQQVEVLQSITKDRAKIPVKRRPSTRKGRLEAIRRSAADLPFHEENYSENDTENSSDSPSLKVKEVEIISRLSDDNNSVNTKTKINEPKMDSNHKPNDISNQPIVNTSAVSDIPKKSFGLFSSSPSDNVFLTESPKESPKLTEILHPSSNPDVKAPEIPKRLKKITRLFDDDGSGDEIKHDLDSSKLENPPKLFGDSDDEIFSRFKSDKTETKRSDILGGPDFLSSENKKTSKLVGGSDEEIFSSEKTVEATIKTGETIKEGVVKTITKLFNESDDETVGAQTNDNLQPALDNRNTNKRTSKLFNGSDEEIFSSTKPVETIKESVVKTMTKLFNESDDETARAQTKDDVHPTADNRNTNKTTTKLFNESDEELFSSVSKSSNKKKTVRLFGSDDESDDELFRNSNGKTAGKTSATVSKTVLPKSQEHSKKSLFNDSSSDDDLFSSGSKSGKQGRRPREPVKTQTRPQGFKKSENKETSEDPLSKFL